MCCKCWPRVTLEAVQVTALEVLVLPLASQVPLPCITLHCTALHCIALGGGVLAIPARSWQMPASPTLYWTLPAPLVHARCSKCALKSTIAEAVAWTHAASCKLQAEMAGSPETAAILEALNSQRADARERQAAMERQIREEARRLRGGVAGSACSHCSLCICMLMHSCWHTCLLHARRCCR